MITGNAYRIVTESQGTGRYCQAAEFNPQVPSYTSVAPGQSCTLRVIFAPTEAGSDPGSIQIDAYKSTDPDGTYPDQTTGAVLNTKKLAMSGTGK